MVTKTILSGTSHSIPNDLKHAIQADESAIERWQYLTPLARNEWICWIITCKKPETRQNHIGRTVTELLQGKRRPCCWAGCIHRQKNTK